MEPVLSVCTLSYKGIEEKYQVKINTFSYFKIIPDYELFTYTKVPYPNIPKDAGVTPPLITDQVIFRQKI